MKVSKLLWYFLYWFLLSDYFTFCIWFFSNAVKKMFILKPHIISIPYKRSQEHNAVTYHYPLVWYCLCARGSSPKQGAQKKDWEAREVHLENWFPYHFPPKRQLLLKMDLSLKCIVKLGIKWGCEMHTQNSLCILGILCLAMQVVQQSSSCEEPLCCW